MTARKSSAVSHVTASLPTKPEDRLYNLSSGIWNGSCPSNQSSSFCISISGHVLGTVQCSPVSDDSARWTAAHWCTAGLLTYTEHTLSLMPRLRVLQCSHWRQGEFLQVVCMSCTNNQMLLEINHAANSNKLIWKLSRLSYLSKVKEPQFIR